MHQLLVHTNERKTAARRPRQVYRTLGETTGSNASFLDAQNANEMY